MQKNTLIKFYEVIKGLTIIGLVISAPFILAVGLGLIAFAPLLYFLLLHNRLIKAAKADVPFGLFKPYLIGATLSGAGSAFGFYALWGLSHGIDTEETPFLPFLLMAIIGCPLITFLVIFLANKWQKLKPNIVT